MGQAEGHARRAFELLDSTGLLACVLPAGVVCCDKVPEYRPQHDEDGQADRRPRKVSAGSCREKRGER